MTESVDEELRVAEISSVLDLSLCFGVVDVLNRMKGTDEFPFTRT